MTEIMWLVDFILHVDKHLVELFQNYGVWIYGILFVIVFCETGLVATPFLPGDSLLFAAGSLMALSGLNVHSLVVLMIIAAILGDTVNYSIGHYAGEKWGRKIFAYERSWFFNPAYLQKAEQFYEKYGAKTIIIARFIPIVRTFAPFVAGVSKMHYRTFITYNVIGAFLWVLLFTYAGYFLGETPFVKRNFSVIIIAIIFISIMPPFIEYARHRLSERQKHP